MEKVKQKMAKELKRCEGCNGYFEEKVMFLIEKPIGAMDRLAGLKPKKVLYCDKCVKGLNR